MGNVHESIQNGYMQATATCGMTGKGASTLFQLYSLFFVSCCHAHFQPAYQPCTRHEPLLIIGSTTYQHLQQSKSTINQVFLSDFFCNG